MIEGDLQQAKDSLQDISCQLLESKRDFEQSIFCSTEKDGNKDNDTWSFQNIDIFDIDFKSESHVMIGAQSTNIMKFSSAVHNLQHLAIVKYTYECHFKIGFL